MNLMINIASEVDQSGRPRAASSRVFAVTTNFEAPDRAFAAIRTDCTRKTYLQLINVALSILGHSRGCPPYTRKHINERTTASRRACQ